MTKEKLVAAMSLKDKIDALTINLEKAKSIGNSSLHLSYISARDKHTTINFITEETQRILQRLVISDLESNIAKTQANFDSL